jgi:hypothetical protein
LQIQELCLGGILRGTSRFAAYEGRRRSVSLGVAGDVAGIPILRIWIARSLIGLDMVLMQGAVVRCLVCTLQCALKGE